MSLYIINKHWNCGHLFMLTLTHVWIQNALKPLLQTADEGSSYQSFVQFQQAYTEKINEVILSKSPQVVWNSNTSLEFLRNFNFQHEVP